MKYTAPGVVLVVTMLLPFNLFADDAGSAPAKESFRSGANGPEGSLDDNGGGT